MTKFSARRADSRFGKQVSSTEFFSMSDTPIEVSIIIVNWNTVDLLRQCLRSVYLETQPINFEVIVVDNASSDDSVAMVRREFCEVKLIVNIENRGFAA